MLRRVVFSVNETATLGEIADLMEAKEIKRVPVVHDAKIVGIEERQLKALRDYAAGLLGTRRAMLRGPSRSSPALDPEPTAQTDRRCHDNVQGASVAEIEPCLMRRQPHPATGQLLQL